METQLPLERGDNHVIAFAKAISRSQSLITDALMAEDNELYERHLADAQCIGKEWGFTEDLKWEILKAASEHAYGVES